MEGRSKRGRRIHWVAPPRSLDVTMNAKLVLIPPSDEQAWSSFHVADEFRDEFIAFLRGKGIEIKLPPEPLGRPGEHPTDFTEIEVAEEHSQADLEAVEREFAAGYDLKCK